MFGVALGSTRAAAYLTPGWGTRSLATVVVAATDLRFSAVARRGAAEPDLRVELPLPELAGKPLPIKDHHLLLRTELADDPAVALCQAVRAVGPRVAVRLGLSRAFQATPNRGPGLCWLMADGFFSHADPQP